MIDEASCRRPLCKICDRSKYSPIPTSYDWKGHYDRLYQLHGGLNAPGEVVVIEGRTYLVTQSGRFRRQCHLDGIRAEDRFVVKKLPYDQSDPKSIVTSSRQYWENIRQREKEMGLSPDDLRREAERLLQRAALMERVPVDDPFEDGQVITFTKTFRPNRNAMTYQYAAIRCDGGNWFTTGPQSPKSYTWQELIDWLGPDNATRIKVVNSVLSLDEYRSLPGGDLENPFVDVEPKEA